MTSSTNKTTYTFPYPSLTKLPDGQTPDFFTVRQWKKELSANAAAVSSTLGGGAHGMLGIVISGAAYTAIAGAGVVWNDPDFPGSQPTYPAGANAEDRAEIKEEWEHDTQQYELYSEVQGKLRKQLLEACPEIYMEAQRDDITGFAMCHPRHLLEQLEEDFGQMTPDDEKTNRENLGKPWDPTTPIQTLWKQATDCQHIATAGGHPLEAMTIVNTMLGIIEKTGLFEDDIRVWRRRPMAEWTFANLRTDFNRADKERRRKLTARDAGYTSTLPAANAAKEEKEKDTKNGPTQWYYCWSHGLGRNKDHTSKTCKNRKEGHKEEATIDNMMGGCNTIVRPRGQKPAPVFRQPRPNPNGGGNDDENNRNRTNQDF